MIQRRRRNPRLVRLVVGRQAFVKKGLTFFDPHDSYYFAVSLSWPRFILLFIAAELGLNTLFAVLYALQPNAVANQPWPGFWSGFFFSLETLATVGYGEMYPTTLYGHIVASCEIIVGVAFTALVTGLLFTRFARPKAKLIYADHAVVTPNEGKPTLMLRIANGRSNFLHDAEVALNVLVRVTTIEGHSQFNVVSLPLLRDRMPVMAVFWTIMHVIDDGSPLAALRADSADLDQVRLFVTLRAKDQSIGQEVTDIHVVEGADIRFGMRYCDAITRDGDGRTVIADYALISAIEPDGVPRVQGRARSDPSPAT